MGEKEKKKKKTTTIKKHVFHVLKALEVSLSLEAWLYTSVQARERAARLSARSAGAG